MYKDYLKSKNWSNTRNAYFTSRKYNDKCCICNTKLNAKFDLHHLTYKNIGEESLSDLRHVCRYCHNDLHDFGKKKGLDNITTFHILRKRAMKLRKRKKRRSKRREFKKHLSFEEFEYEAQMGFPTKF